MVAVDLPNHGGSDPARSGLFAVCELGDAFGGRIYCAAANSIGYRLGKPSREAKADHLARSTRFAKLRAQVGFLDSYPAETPALARDVARIDTPVQVLHGEFDTFVWVSNAQRLADLLPNSRVAIIPGAAHYAWKDNPSDYLEKVLGFIE